MFHHFLEQPEIAVIGIALFQLLIDRFTHIDLTAASLRYYPLSHVHSCASDTLLAIDVNA